MPVKSYNVIIKAPSAPNGWLKFRGVTTIGNLQSYLTKVYPDWRFCNVYDRKTKKQVGAFSQKNPTYRSGGQWVFPIPPKLS